MTAWQRWTYPKALAHKAVNDWIHKRIRHSNPMTNKKTHIIIETFLLAPATNGWWRKINDEL